LLRYPTEALGNDAPHCVCPASALLCSALLTRPRVWSRAITSFVVGRPPYKSNFYCHPGRAGGTPILLVQNAPAHAADYAVPAADHSDCRSTNNDRTMPTDAAGTIDTARTDGCLGVIGTPCDRENRRADDNSDCQHSQGCPSLAVRRIFMEPRPTHHIANKTRPTYDRLAR
jgi:hypothetical protein